jgi:hypothetical protein
MTKEREGRGECLMVRDVWREGFSISAISQELRLTCLLEART